MEIKLTTDWIFLHNSEVFCMDGKCYFKIYDNDFQYYLINLALKTLNVKYCCDELYDESDENFENPSYHYSFENIEDIKETCPALYAEFNKRLAESEIWEDEVKKRQDIILKFLDIPKTIVQIHKHLVNEVYRKDEGLKSKDQLHKMHTEYLIERLMGKDIIKTEKKKYSRC